MNNQNNDYYKFNYKVKETASNTDEKNTAETTAASDFTVPASLSKPEPVKAQEPAAPSETKPVGEPSNNYNTAEPPKQVYNSPGAVNIGKETTYNSNQTNSSGASKIKDFDYRTYAITEQRASNASPEAGLILGICSLVFLWVPIVGLVLGIVGLIFSIKAMKGEERHGMAIGGLICSIIGCLIGISVMIGTIALLIYSFTDAAPSTDVYNYGQF